MQAQRTQEQQYNKGTKVRSFEPGDRIFLLLPSTTSKLQAKWQGPFKVSCCVGLVDYEIWLLNEWQEVHTYHVNLMKAWKTREGMFIAPTPLEPELGPLARESEEQ